MKKSLMFLFFIFFLTGCITETDRAKFPKPKYYVGEIVYMKPDSTKAVITFVSMGGSSFFYAVRYTDKSGQMRETNTGDWGSHLLSESELY